MYFHVGYIFYLMLLDYLVMYSLCSKLKMKLAPLAYLLHGKVASGEGWPLEIESLYEGPLSL